MSGRGSDVEQYLRTRFLERVAHDIRGPVGVTSGALDELEIAFSDRLGDGERALFTMARRGLRKLVRISDRLARAAQLETSPLEVAVSRLDARRLVITAVDEARFLEGRRGVSVDLEIPDVTCDVFADGDWLGLAVTEIVGNAIRHARRQVRVSVRSGEREARIVIEDDGAGLKTELGSRFSPTEEPRGLGLAIPMTKDVMTAHHGRVELRDSSLSNEPNRKGTAVILALPLAEDA